MGKVSIKGFNCAGMMSSIEWPETPTPESQDQQNKLVNTLNELQPETLRVFDGGGYRYVHTMWDEHGNKSKGLGYRRAEIEEARANGDLDDEEYASYIGKIEKQETLDCRYIDKFIELYKRLNYRPNVIYVVNVKSGTVEEEMSAISLLTEHVNLYGVEMGNETYGHTFGTFSLYETAVLPFATAIRSVFTSVKISLVAAPLDAKRHEKWNADLAEFLASPSFDVDAVVPHIYYKVEGGEELELMLDQFEGDLWESDSSEIAQALNLHVTYSEYFGISIGDTISEYKTMFPGKEIWVTEYGTTPAHPFNNTFADIPFIVSSLIPVCATADIACYQTLLGPDFHGSMTIKKPLDPPSFSTPVWRSKMMAWNILSDISGMDAMSNCYADVDENGFKLSICHFASGDKHALLVVNGTDSEYKINATTDEDHSLGFITLTQASFGKIFGSVGSNDIYKMIKFYDGKTVEKNASITVSEDSDVVMPFSIGVAMYDRILVVEEPEEEVKHPHIKLPKNKKGFFKRLISQLGWC